MDRPSPPIPVKLPVRTISDDADPPESLTPCDLAADALRTITAGHAAENALREIDAGTARPDELAELLLALLTGLHEGCRLAVIKGFLRPISKRLEGRTANAVRVPRAE